MTSHSRLEIKLRIIVILGIILSSLFTYHMLTFEPEQRDTMISEPTHRIYSDFESGFGLYIVNGIRITYDEISNSQYLICIDNHPVRIHETEQAAKEQMDRLLKYYKGES